MSNQLDILALEPYYGGFRREMLETLARHSRHRWKILKLPPRRLERRLTTAALWFAEQMSRHAVGQFDVLFTTETLNLADLYRLVPALSRKPSVVYFHSHQLGDSSSPDQPHDYANLSSASAATELWFISKFGRRDFFSTAQDLVGRDAELTAQNVLASLTPKSHVVAPPVNSSIEHDAAERAITDGKAPITIFFNAHGADFGLVARAFEIVRSDGLDVVLKVLGPTAGLPRDIAFEAVVAGDPSGVFRAVAESRFYLSVSPACGFDENAVRALASGRPALIPKAGGYVEIASAFARSEAMYKVEPCALANALARSAAASLQPTGYRVISDREHRFEPIAATKVIDDRLIRLSVASD